MEGITYHKTSCNKDSYTPTSCDCGFTARWIKMDHSKNVPSVTDKSFKPYDALSTLKNKDTRKNMEEKLPEVIDAYDQYHDPDDWVPASLEESDANSSAKENSFLLK